MSDAFTVPVRWTDDCQGKKDLDGELVALSTRCWPRGGGFSVLGLGTAGEFVDSGKLFPHVKPSAGASILLRVGPMNDEGGEPDPLVLAGQDFEGETQEDVQRAVEAWAQAQYDRIVKALRAEFALPFTETGHA